LSLSKSSEVGYPARKTALTTYIYKIASRCNLACTYCYMYNGPDQTWRELPVFMTIDTAELAANEIGRYSESVGLTSVSIVLHGGEPLLYPVVDLDRMLSLTTKTLELYGVTPNYSLQTNATVIRRGMIEVLTRHDVGVGVSLDLSPGSHDRFRVDKKGRGTYARTIEGIAALREASGGSEPRGLLLVIDTSVPPLEAFETIEALGVSYVDVLLPDETWDTADPGELKAQFEPWLLEFFDLYSIRERTFQIRWFQTALKLAVGGLWGSDSMGLRNAGTIILETDGQYHFHDVLRTATEALNRTGEMVGSDGLSRIELLPLMRTMMDKYDLLAPPCRSCRVVDICGGGHIAHRFSSDREFDNPSVYCEAIKPLYERITREVAQV
jgi:uncharacterized protein